jgi:DNA-3-methyladenine glycosylase I
MAADDVARCTWASLSDPAYLAYHDQEWGTPTRSERALLELLILEGAQAGLSWSTILHRRDGYRRAFLGFDPDAIAQFDAADGERLLSDTGIVRNRAKVSAAIGNARAWVAMRDAGLDPVDHLWSFVGGQPLINNWHGLDEIPAETVESQAMSRDLRTRGFSFVGPTICYAFMQAAGLVNDHMISCFRYRELVEAATARS